MKETLEVIGKGTAIAATAIFTLSVVYDWGFLYALDLDFGVVPTTVGDHVRNALVWLPLAVLGLFLGLTAEFFNQRVERGLTEEEIVSSAKNPGKLRKWRNSPYIFFKILFIFATLLFILLGDFFIHSISISAAATWYIFSSWMGNAPLIKIRRDPVVTALFKWCPALFLFIFFLGYGDAFKTANKTIAAVGILSRETEAYKSVNILMALENGV